MMNSFEHFPSPVVKDSSVGRVLAGRERLYSIDLHLEWLAKRRAEQRTETKGTSLCEEIVP